MKKLAEVKQGLEKDLQYVLWFPKGEKYISLFPSSGTVRTPAELRQQERLRDMAAAGEAAAASPTKLNGRMAA